MIFEELQSTDIFSNSFKVKTKIRLFYTNGIPYFMIYNSKNDLKNLDKFFNFRFPYKFEIGWNLLQVQLDTDNEDFDDVEDERYIITQVYSLKSFKNEINEILIFLNKLD